MKSTNDFTTAAAATTSTTTITLLKDTHIHQ